MKRFIILALVALSMFGVKSEAASKHYHSMMVRTTKIVRQWKVEVYWRGGKIASYIFNSKPKVKFVKSSKLNYNKLTNRKNKVLYIEIITGKQINSEGDGKVDTKDPYFNYISYKRCGFKEGDRIRTYCIYNPYTNWEDDIIERYDEIIR